jgi:site-specific recombinase XerD
METKLTIVELVEKVLSELERLKYSYNYLCGFRAFCRRMIVFATSKNEKYFSVAFGAEFLREKCNCVTNILTKEMSPKQRSFIRKIRVLEDYQLNGIITRRVKKPGYIKPKQFEKILASYEIECQKRNYSKIGLRGRMQRLLLFIDFLDSKRLQDVKQITPIILSDYIKTICNHHEKSMSAILTSLRTFLKFLYVSQHTEKDLSLDLPKLKKYYSPATPSAWTTEDVKMMLQCIDRGSPAGKRDYAILLLVVRLGIRAGDMRDLKLHDLNWNTKQIEIQQEKTGHHVTYPILDDIGDALIDYLKNGRPLTVCPFVFVRACAPYEAFSGGGSLYHIIAKYTRLAGIPIASGPKHGLHSLRHKLANTLLEQETSIPVISAILGHLSSKSTNIYLHADIEGLKQCALDPDEVFKYGT